MEGTGCYGAALARFLAANHQVVLEVNRPDRAARRRHGTSDPVDAQAAARAVQAGEVMVVPKAGGGQVETIGCLRVARSTGVRARTQTINALKALLVTAPVELREQLRGLSVTRLVGAAATLEPGPITSPLAAAMLALGTLAHRHQALSAEVDASPASWTGWSPRLRPGWWRCSASAKTAPARCWSPPATTLAGCEAMPASRCCVAPRRSRRPPAKTTRHRLNRGGDRQANAALYRIVLVRLCHDQQTKDYMARRLKEGKSKKEIIRCLKRYVAREVFAVLSQMDQGNLTAAA